MLYIYFIYILKNMKKEAFHLSCHLVYEEKILFPGDGSQGKFSSVSVALAEIRVDEHGV